MLNPRWLKVPQMERAPTQKTFDLGKLFFWLPGVGPLVVMNETFGNY